MAAPVRPAGAKTYGRKKCLFVPTLADPDAPTVTELTAAGVLELETYLYRDASSDPSVSQDGVTAPPRVSDTQQFQSRGDAQWSGGTAVYMVDPQATAGSDGKKAFEALPEGTTGFLVYRRGIAFGTDIAAGDFVSSYPVEFGAPFEADQGDGAAAEAAISQPYFVTGAPSLIKAVAA